MVLWLQGLWQAGEIVELGGNLVNTKKIDNHVTVCLEEVVEHLLQDRVNSSHIKNIRNGLIEIRQCLENLSETPQTFPSGVKWKVNTRTSTKVLGGDLGKDSILVIAFAMSKFDYVLFNNLYSLNLNQGEVFEMVAALLGVKSTTLRNYRDTFDSHVVAVRGRQRKGWKKPLPPEFKVVMERLDSLDEDEMANVVAETLMQIRSDSELVIRIAYGFLFASRAAKSTSEITIDGRTFELINAPYPKGIAYLVFTGFGNTLTKGIYPAVYVYREFGKVFTVFGESVTHAPSKKWQLPSGEHSRIESYFTEEALELIRTYPHTYLSNHVYREFDIDQNAIGYGEYKIELAEQLANDLKDLVVLYAESL